MPRRSQDVGELLALVGAAPRESIPALLAKLAARLAEPEPTPPPQPLPPPREQPGAQGDRLLTAEEVALRLGLDVAAVDRRRFPFRVKLGRRTIRFSEAGLCRWMKEGH